MHRSGAGPDTGGYTDVFFTGFRQGARRSAQVIVPLVLEMFRPASIIDIGCGVGSWLALFREQESWL